MRGPVCVNKNLLADLSARRIADQREAPQSPMPFLLKKGFVFAFRRFALLPFALLVERLLRCQLGSLI